MILQQTTSISTCERYILTNRFLAQFSRTFYGRQQNEQTAPPRWPFQQRSKFPEMRRLGACKYVITARTAALFVCTKGNSLSFPSHRSLSWQGQSTHSNCLSTGVLYVIVTAQSKKTLTKSFAAQFQSQGVVSPNFASAAAPAAKRTAIFGIHGISPTQRYAFQDQVATSLQSALNALEHVKGSDFSWNAIVHWPQVSGKDTVGNLRPSALRLYRDDDDPVNPVHDVYDVYEGYWSPLSKGKTNILSALQWLLNCTFLGTSSTANIPCTRAKLRSDLIYVGGLAAVIVVAFVLALVAGFLSWSALGCSIPGMCHTSFSSLIANPLAIAAQLPLRFYAQLVVEVAAAYVVVQLWVVHGVSTSRRARTDELSKDAKAKGWFQSRTIQAAAFHRCVSVILWIALVVSLAVAAFLVVVNSRATHASPELFALSSFGVVATVLLLQLARAKADFAVEDVLGDIRNLYDARRQCGVLRDPPGHYRSCERCATVGIGRGGSGECG